MEVSPKSSVQNDVVAMIYVGLTGAMFTSLPSSAITLKRTDMVALVKVQIPEWIHSRIWNGSPLALRMLVK